jgi:hypothetical protein
VLYLSVFYLHSPGDNEEYYRESQSVRLVSHLGFEPGTSGIHRRVRRLNYFSMVYVNGNPGEGECSLGNFILLN